MILVPCIHFCMYIGTRAENENGNYLYFKYTVMKVLLNSYIHCSFVHSYGISCSTSSSSYSSSLSAYSFWQSSEHRQRSVQTSPAFWHWQRLLEQLGALASDKLSNCLWSWWKICHGWYPLSIFILPSIAFWWGQHRVCYMIVVPNKKLVVRSQYGLMESSLCGRQALRLSLIFLKEGPSEGFDSFDVCPLVGTTDKLAVPLHFLYRHLAVPHNRG